MNAIEMNRIDFSYKKGEPLLHNIAMNIPSGSIYGFLGPNGAGKTTTLKLILNLLKNSSKGTISVLGKNISQYYPNYLSEIGSLIEEPSIYQHLSANDNLKIWSNYFGSGSARIDEVLDTVGLIKATHQKVHTFSTGMKQRLGIGIAIMHDPQILILDEPTNGLDPIGISDLRTLMNNLTAQGKTIIFSSHMLSEVERLVDYVGIIKDGRIKYEGTLDELKSKTVKRSNILVKLDNPLKAQALLERKFNSSIVEENLVIQINSAEEVNQVLKELIDNDFQIYELIQPKFNLETIFMNLAK